MGRSDMLTSSTGCSGFDKAAIAERLRLLELDSPGALVDGKTLQRRVIRPNLESVVGRFCDSLVRVEEINSIVTKHSGLDRLRGIQEQYLLSLGVDFQRREYFEERQRIGSVHQKIGVPQSLYQCTYRQLQDLLIEHVPAEMRDDRDVFASMIRFILKITTLDMSLAVESYCTDRVSNLKRTLQSERDETERLRKLSITDWLTDLHNHSYSRRCLSAALDRSQKEKMPLCVIMADLDHFKNINDTHGHLIGDDVLRIAAARMLSAARSADLVGRYGGEEFLFILQDTDLADGEEVAERVRSRIRVDTVHCGEARIEVTMSLGLAEARTGDSVDDLIERADAALYAAKGAGRDCVKTYSPEVCEISAST